MPGRGEKCGLVTAHLITDFLLESQYEVGRGSVDWKATGSPKHALLHATITYVVVAQWQVWQIPLLVLAAHLIIDLATAGVYRWLAPRRPENAAPSARWDIEVFSLDQVAHFASLVAIVKGLSLLPIPVTASPGDWSVLFDPFWPGILVLVAGALWTIMVGGVVVGILVGPLLSELRTTLQANRSIEPLRRGFQNGGRYIGQLERALIFLFVLSGQVQGVGFLVAAKSIFRFGDLKEHNDRMEAEYIIIGTMLSFGWGLAFSLLTKWAMGL